MFLLIEWAGKFTDQKSAAFPYLLASQKNQKIFHVDCVPKGFVLSDPDHITNAKISTLYLHWLARQDKKLPPFVVLNPGPHHQAAQPKSAKAKEKRKMEYVDVSTDDEVVKSAGEEDEEGEQSAGGEEEEGVQSSDQEDLGPTVKFGPPRSKRPDIAGPSNSMPNVGDKNAVAEQDKTNRNNVAGPSKPPQKKTDRSKEIVGPSKQTQLPPKKTDQSKKRKPEEDPEPRPTKTLKTGKVAKSAMGTDKVVVVQVGNSNQAPMQGPRLICLP